MLAMRRDQDFTGARAMLTQVLERGGSGKTFLPRLRAVAAASAGDVHVAREDAAFLKARGEPGAVVGIEARIRLAQKDYDGAEAALADIKVPSGPDELLRARVLEARADDPATPFDRRQALRGEAALIRDRNRMDEYDFVEQG